MRASCTGELASSGPPGAAVVPPSSIETAWTFHKHRPHLPHGHPPHSRSIPPKVHRCNSPGTVSTRVIHNHPCMCQARVTCMQQSPCARSSRGRHLFAHFIRHGTIVDSSAEYQKGEDQRLQRSVRRQSRRGLCCQQVASYSYAPQFNRIINLHETRNAHCTFCILHAMRTTLLVQQGASQCNAHRCL